MVLRPPLSSLHDLDACIDEQTEYHSGHTVDGVTHDRASDGSHKTEDEVRENNQDYNR